MKEITPHQKHIVEVFEKKKLAYIKSNTIVWEAFVDDVQKYAELYGDGSTLQWVETHIPITYESTFGKMALKTRHKTNPREIIDIQEKPSAEQMQTIVFSRKLREEYLDAAKQIDFAFRDIIDEAEKELGIDRTIDWLYENIPDCVFRMLEIDKLLYKQEDK